MKKLIILICLLTGTKGYSDESSSPLIFSPPEANLKILCHSPDLGKTYEIYDLFSAKNFTNACVRIISDDGNAEKVGSYGHFSWEGMTYSFQDQGTQDSIFVLHNAEFPLETQIYHGGVSHPVLCTINQPETPAVNSTEAFPS